MRSHRTVYMHGTDDHPMRMIIGVNFGEYKKLSEYVKETVLDSIDLREFLEDPGVPDAVGEELSTCSYDLVELRDPDVWEVDVRNIDELYLKKFTPAIIYDNANDDVWIGIDLGYELCKDGAAHDAYERSGAIDAARLAQMITLFTEYWNGTELAQYGSPSVATLWSQ